MQRPAQKKMVLSSNNEEHNNCQDGIWTLFKKKKKENFIEPWFGEILPSDLAQYKLFHLPYKTELQMSPFLGPPKVSDCLQGFLMF